MLRIPHDALVGPRRLATFGRSFVIHGARLAVAFTVATLIAETIFPLPHAYWLPMTVAWLTKPGLNDSAVRLVQRFFGTAVGVTIVSIVLSLVWSDPFAIIVIGVAMAVIVAFAVPNYLIATEGVTVFVLTLFYFDGSPLVETVPARVVATGVAAVLVWLVMVLWRPTVADRVLLDLVEQARTLRLYALACRGGDLKATETARIDVVQARIAAGAAIKVSENEWVQHRVDEECAEAVHRDLIRASTIPVIVEIAGDPEMRASLTDAALENLDGLTERLVAQDWAWLGLIGSRAKVTKFHLRLRAAGVSPERLARISGPVGLDIGAETPEEIAISVLAEMIRVRRKVDRPPLPLGLTTR